MIVAGSVLALLLMGLAVDGLVSSADEDVDDAAPDTGGEGDQSDESGEGDGLTDMLLVNDGPAETPDAALSNSHLDASDAEDEEEEANADEVWADLEATPAEAEFLEVHAVAAVESGEEVAYVDGFDPATDTLVLEFDGAEDDAPELAVEYDSEEDAATVLANGVPVTLVDGGEDMTTDHIRIIMGGDETDLGPQVLPDAEDSAAMDRLEDLTGPQTQALPNDVVEVSKADDTDGPLTQFTDLAPVNPDDATLDAILDQVTDDLTSFGGNEEMLEARAGIDDAFGTGGNDALTGSFNDEMITGSDGEDALFGNEGDDTLMAGAGNDEMCGDTGNDDLQGDEGIDFLDGGEGNDTLDGGGDRDLLFGGDGDDVLYGGAANDFLQGGMGTDMLNGGSGDDILDGVYGDGTNDMDDADILWGGSGDDHLIIGEGDTAHGGAGADTFAAGSYIENAEVAGHVTDFNPIEDRIEVIFDPQESPDPTLEVLDFADGSGADIILNGEVILSVAGAQGLDPNMIDLRATA